MSNKVSEIVKSFNSGTYCSQAVLFAYCEDFGLDREIAMKLSCGMAAGMARLCSVCGAVTGAYLVMGLKYGSNLPNDIASTEKTFALIQEFDRLFSEKHGSTNCKGLLGVDLRSGDKSLASERVRLICPVLVKDAAEILETILQ